jgi:hypothetical protein
MKHSKTLIAAAVAALIAGTAVAEDYGKDKSSKHGAAFNTLDTNRDGRISKAEAAADSKLVFSTADANGDGYLDAAEYSAALKSDSMAKPQSSEPASDTAGSPPAPSTPADTEPGGAPQPDTETPRQ